MRRGVLLAAIAVGLSVSVFSQASNLTLETSDLIVSDNTRNLPDERLRELADQAQDALNKVLAFWSTDSGTDRFGKIRVVFDAPRRGIYSSLFSWKKKDGKLIRIVSVFGSEGPPQMMAHKLTSAVFPQKDKLIRNIMGTLSEAQVGNSISFPMCGFSSDVWVLALLATNSYIPLNELGPDHESWGMRETRGGELSIFDRPKQHKAYAEAASFGNYLFQIYGVNKIKQFNRLSHEKQRSSQETFGANMQELEANWLSALRANEKARGQNVLMAAKLIKENPNTACSEAQRIATSKR